MSHIYSWNEQVYVKPETTWLALVKPTSTDAVTVLSSTIEEGGNERRTRMDKSNTRSVRTMIQGRRAGTWSLNMYAMGSGAAGTEPDASDLWEYGLGTKVISGGVSVTYSLLKNIDAKTLQITRHAEGVSQLAMGCFVDQVKLDLSGIDEPKVAFSGPCAYAVWTGTDTIQAGASSTVQTVANARNFRIGSIVRFGNNTLNGTGYKVTARDTSANTITVDASLVTQTGDQVYPFQPTATLQSVNPVFGTNGSFVIVGHPGIEMRTGSLTVINQAQLRNDIYGEDFATGISISRKRGVEWNFDWWADAQKMRWMGLAEDLVALTMTATSGDTAGNIITANMNNAILDIPVMNWPDEGEINMTANATLTDPNMAEGECTLVFT